MSVTRQLLFPVDSPELPSQQSHVRTWRARQNPFEKVWPDIEVRLAAEPEPRAFALFEWLQTEHPGQFSDSQRRTFERRVRQWRAVRSKKSSSRNATNQVSWEHLTSRT